MPAQRMGDDPESETMKQPMPDTGDAGFERIVWTGIVVCLIVLIGIVVVMWPK